MLVPRFERITLPFVQKLFYLILFHLSYPELKIFHRGVMEISSFVRVDILKRLKISRVKFIAGRGKLIKIAMGVRLFLFFFFFSSPYRSVDIRAAVWSANLRDLSFHKSVLWSWQ